MEINNGNLFTQGKSRFGNDQPVRSPHRIEDPARQDETNKNVLLFILKRHFLGDSDRNQKENICFLEDLFPYFKVFLKTFLGTTGN